jgi:hypothetical protein
MGLISLRLLHHNKEPAMKVHISHVVKAIEALNRIEKASMKQFEDPRFVGTLQAEALIAMWPLKHAIENSKVEVTVEGEV